MSDKASVGIYKYRQQKAWFDKDCSKLLEQRKQNKLQYLQHPSHMNRDNLNIVVRESSRHFWNKTRL
jgi:hypothetical protein